MCRRFSPPGGTDEPIAGCARLTVTDGLSGACVPPRHVVRPHRARATSKKFAREDVHRSPTCWFGLCCAPVWAAGSFPLPVVCVQRAAHKAASAYLLCCCRVARPTASVNSIALRRAHNRIDGHTQRCTYVQYTVRDLSWSTPRLFMHATDRRNQVTHTHTQRHITSLSSVRSIAVYVSLQRLAGIFPEQLSVVLLAWLFADTEMY